MVNNKRNWCCPHCPQTSSRHWNLKTHIERWHHGIGQPILEDKWHSTPNTTSSSLATMHFIPGMMSLQNNNNYDLNHQRYTQTFSASPYSKKGDDTSKKRDPVEECLEFWRRKTQQIKEFQEIKKTIGEFFSSSSSSQQPNIITSLGQTSIIRPIIPPPVTTIPLQPTPPQPAQSSQEQKKKENINPTTTFGANIFNTSTFMAEDPHRRARGGGEAAIIIPQEPSLIPYMRTTISDNNKYSKKRGEPNPITENKEEKQELKEDRHDIEEYHIEEHPSSKCNLLIDNEDGYVINNNIDCDDSSNIDNNYDYSSDVSLVIKRDDHGDIYE